jgi:hypothetical protein
MAKTITQTLSMFLSPFGDLSILAQVCVKEIFENWIRVISKNSHTKSNQANKQNAAGKP